MGALSRVSRIVCMAALASLGVACGQSEPKTKPPAAAPLNFVIFLTDDQRWDTLWVMPLVTDRLARNGVTFANAFVTDPECCPMRASLHSGGYDTTSTEVLRNAAINGGMSRFNDKNTLATTFNKAGWRTGFVGRYMHGYIPGYMPPGYDYWVANSYINARDWNHLTQVTMATRTAGVENVNIADVDQYVTDFHRDKALEFLRKGDKRPFYLLVAFYAPHEPHTPSPEDADLFGAFTNSNPGVDEVDLTDKPAWMTGAAAAQAPLGDLCTTTTPRAALRSLQSVDRAVAAIIDEVEAAGEADNTVFIFTSDNGLLWGEHGLPCEKGIAFEESIRVPLVVRWPGKAGGTRAEMISVNLDVGATLYEALEVPYGGDGLSLIQLLDGRADAWRTDLWLGNYGYLEANMKGGMLWSGMRRQTAVGTWKMVEYPTGEIELYDLIADPYELTSVHADISLAALKAEMHTLIDAHRGLAIFDTPPPAGQVNQSFNFQPRTWGGTQPIDWDLAFGTLPPGLDLNPTTGAITGTPTTPGNFRIWLRARGQRVATHSGNRESYRREYVFSIAP